jgi:hypothetical protein
VENVPSEAEKYVMYDIGISLTLFGYERVSVNFLIYSHLYFKIQDFRNVVQYHLVVTKL